MTAARGGIGAMVIVAAVLAVLMLGGCTSLPLFSSQPSAHHRLTGGPVSSSAVAVTPDGRLVAAVNPDSNSITLVDATTLVVLAEIPVGNNPRSLSFTPDSQKALVTNYGSAMISVVDLSEPAETAQYRVGSMPYGVVSDGIYAFVAEYAHGMISVIDLGMGMVVRRIPVDPFPAGLALSRDRERLFVTHFFTGSVTVINLTLSVVHETLQTGLDTNLSQSIAIAPDGVKAYLPQTRSNTTNKARLFDTTVFPIVNVLKVADLEISVPDRITLDTADVPVSMPFAVALSPDGETLYLANAGSDDVSVIDLNTNRGIAHITVGSNPQGIAITPDGSRVFVNNVLDGTLSVVDTGSLSIIDQVTLTEIPLASLLLQGKRIFNSAAAPILTTDNWIACATCHFDGAMDARTWLAFPDGPRNTPSLQGVGDTLPIHWSGDFDELQDVEITIRDIQFGEGLIPGQAYDSLGPSHAGLSDGLDALAAYLASIKVSQSPHREDRDAISNGNAVFVTLGCDSCHMPPLYTDLQLHDVGTGNPAKERNTHGRGTQFDTPSLRGAWLTAPYFHDGSAPTLRHALGAGSVHNISDKIDAEEIEALIAFLRSLPEADQ